MFKNAILFLLIFILTLEIVALLALMMYENNWFPEYLEFGKSRLIIEIYSNEYKNYLYIGIIFTILGIALASFLGK